DWKPETVRAQPTALRSYSRLVSNRNQRPKLISRKPMLNADIRLKNMAARSMRHSRRSHRNGFLNHGFAVGIGSGRICMPCVFDFPRHTRVPMKYIPDVPGKCMKTA